MLKVSLSSLLSEDVAENDFDVSMRAVRRYIRAAAIGTNHLIVLDCLSMENDLAVSVLLIRNVLL